ncbi:calvin cycle protein CP12-3, chloroplastic [Impatiens glandulifera]|uniref:calvin cycle protein CP12-3, chloroplastic n=1 Tax=Impatiens glandulifera TaxID=253017 RepID=UPI001FB06647|nr:calvin cycle protein CP12-3, chloroplastic [Impatiens glandulifera]
MAAAPPSMTTTNLLILHRSSLRSSQIYGWPSSCPQIQLFDQKKKKKRSLIFPPAAARASGDDELMKSAKAKYKGTVMREKQLTEMIEKMVMEAKEVCKGDERSDECKVAWDEVEEVSQAKADLRLKLELQHDPLESFCADHPETDECRIYED